MKRQYAELLVGIFVIVSFACIGYMSIKLGKMKIFRTGEYTLKAKFQSVSGLKKDARVEIAGIQIGRVAKMTLDTEDFVAIVEIKLNQSIQVGDDVIASIKTSGLIGDRFIQLSPGGSEDFLEEGDFISETESPIDIEELVGKFVFGKVDK